MADISITAANVVVASGDAVYLHDPHNAGATITAGQTVYLDSSNLWQLSDANGAAALRTTQGIALHSAAANQPLAVCKPGTLLTIGATVTVGGIYVLSATPGGIAPAADLASGWYTNIVGVGKTAAKLQVICIDSGVAVP